MRILRKYRAVELAALALASTFVMATSTCLQGQSLVDAPLPSYYAGHPARMQIAELPPSARIDGEVYDGRPIDGRFNRNPTPRIQIAPQAERNMLRLIEENYKLKAQLKIQEVEFEARQHIEAAEHEQRAAHERIQELEKGNEDFRREQLAAQMRLEARVNEAMQHSERLRIESVKSTQELNELRTVNQQLQQQAKELQAVHERALRETLRKLDEAQQSQAELEHRARALEAQLKELTDKQDSPHKRSKKKGKR